LTFNNAVGQHHFRQRDKKSRTSAASQADPGEAVPMKIDKSCVLPFPVEQVWNGLSNPELVGTCVPGVEKVESIDEKHFLVTVTVKVGIIKPTFRLNVVLNESRAPVYMQSSCTGEANGMMGSLRQTTEIRLERLGAAETRMDVAAEVDVFGRLGTFGYGVLKGKADQLWEQFVANLSTAVREQIANA
jgi:carbon monoxide dehydrogenase subunit G